MNIRKVRRAALAGLLSLLLSLALLPTGALALPAEPSEPLEPLQSSNRFFYSWPNWAEPIESQLFSNGDGTFTRVECGSGGVAVEIYDGHYALVWKKTLPVELELWGGFYAAEEYNFVVFGQSNAEESDECEVMRVVRYTKDWQRVDSASVYGANTYIPFDAGCLRMVQDGDYLFIHTCHEMYAHGDVHHQANMSYVVRISDMALVQQNYRVSSPSNDYCSHSFDQFVLAENGVITKLDLGDAYPRAISLYRGAWNGSSLSGAKRANIVPIPGEVGANYTGVQVGGFEQSSSHYLTAYLGVDYEGVDFTYLISDKVHNVIVAATDKNSFSADGTSLRSFTSFTEEDGDCLNFPKLVKLGADSFLLLWEESGRSDPLHYVFLDGSGTPVSEEYRQEQGLLSQCQPIVENGRVLWYVTRGSAPVFYWIDLKDPSHLGTGDEEPAPEEPVLCGDASGDGLVDGRDAILLAQYLAGWDVRIDEKAADVTGDGQVNGTDAIRLEQYLVGWDVSLG